MNLAFPAYPVQHEDDLANCQLAVCSAVDIEETSRSAYIRSHDRLTIAVSLRALS